MVLPLLLRQIWALIRKNLLLLCLRRPVATFIRALAIPLIVILVVGYSKNFFSYPVFYGISSPNPIYSLKDVSATTSDHNLVGFLDNGMKDGEVSSVISSLSQSIREAGKTPKLYEDLQALSRDCASDNKGVSDCYGAVSFSSSPLQGSSLGPKGVWNYTILGSHAATEGAFIDVRKHDNGPEVYLLPLQRAVDSAIAAQATSDNAMALPATVDEIMFTSKNQDFIQDNRDDEYLALCVSVFGAIFSFSMIGIVYHMTSYVASERELGMTNLIDSMLPGGSALRGRLIRQVSTYASFVLIYLPGWLAVGIVMDSVVFPNTSHGLPIGLHIVSGLAFTSSTLFMASFFRTAQLSGAIATVITLVFAILPMVLLTQWKTLVTIFSLLSPSANYTYFVRQLAQWEMSQQRADVYSLPLFKDVWTLKLYKNFVFLILQILLYPLLAFAVEHVLFSTASPGRSRFVPTDAAGPTVSLKNFCKTYKPSIFSRALKRRQNVQAVVNMNLVAYPGQILCLVGPNGGGKTTTLNCIAGQHKITSGRIDLDATGGLGYAPQSNVIWPELTVEQHIRIFSDLKCLSGANSEVISELVKSCDLEEKLSAKAMTLSGGQKRKLQLAMMFAGGSKVCCIDEVSTGLDPISRRRIWEILLAERGKRTLIMTTHFLDEADFLADTVAIMYKGSLKAEGSTATLKNTYGNGYTVKLDNSHDLDIALTAGHVDRVTSRNQTVYRVASAALAAELIEHLERRQITEYQLSGPTMEELFLKVTGDTIAPDMEDPKPDGSESHPTSSSTTKDKYELKDGRPISAWDQWWLLLCKRFQILKRRYIPYIVTVVLAIAGAAAANLLIRSILPLGCPVHQNTEILEGRRNSLSTLAYADIILGPPERFNESLLQTIVDVYPGHDEGYRGYLGYKDMDALKKNIQVVDTFDHFTRSVRLGQQAGYVNVIGGIWLGDTPTVLSNVEYPYYGLGMQNILNIALSNVPIEAGYASFPYPDIPEIYDIKVLMFMIYFGLIMSAYPAFFTLYPTSERISNVRSMQYSNGIRPIPLWLSHLAFDGIVILLISSLTIALLSVTQWLWYGFGYVFIVLVLYGSASALISYTVSMVAKSAVAAWFYVALFNVIMYFAYFGALIGIQSSTAYEQFEHVNNAVYFGVGVISPVVHLERAIAIGLKQYAMTCNGHSQGSVYLFGGPILYLVLQNVVLFTLLMWWDGAFNYALRTKTASSDPEEEMQSTDLMEEMRRVHSSTTDLRVISVSRRFGKNLAVDNVTFGVQASEIYALLGPNGAGKSTIISMIRGDIMPSTKISRIYIAGHSILDSPIAARANLGVCPQFDSADVLTVTETLRFFAKTRGVQEVDHNVRTVIEACGLEAWAHQLAQKLSGGTKRKLSLAVALIGNPRVLVLDEPSSALDANAKRNMWRTLQSVGKGRAVVLTTHSMEEADALADRIGIVQSRMLASGDREALKKRAGDAFHVHIVARSAPRTSPREIQILKDWVRDEYPNAKISRESQGGQIRFEVPSSGHSLIGIIKTLETVKVGLGVEFYSVGKATLDEVFENIVRKFGDDTRSEK